jgi:anhydro-N-acetylmuramic acid kinase
MSRPTSSNLYIGLMSGTSADAIDAVLVDSEPKNFKVIGHHSIDHDYSTRQDILALCKQGENEINRMGELDNKLGLLFSQAAIELLTKLKVSATQIQAIGSHGQTIRHHPPSIGSHPFSLQVGDANIIASRTGITTVADFRRRDIAEGGEGAPLVPAFHKAVFSDSETSRVILNIGGMANISILSPSLPCTGFDTGPGNVLMDAWIYKHKQLPYDDQGNWGKSGSADHQLLEVLLEHPHFNTLPPKSTGREAFNLNWIEGALTKNKKAISPQDVQATLQLLTVKSIASSIEAHAHYCSEMYVCGGGILNKSLIKSLQSFLPDIKIDSTASLGIPPQLVEASAFAWLAQQTLQKKTGNCPEVTGGSHPVILGGIYQA